MFKFVRNIFSFKIEWKLVYFFAKVHASAHFTYVEKRRAVRFSPMSAMYGAIWGVGYLLLLIFLLTSLDELVEDSNGSVILIFVNGIELIAIALRACSIHFLQVIQSKDLVLLINDAIGIFQVIHSKNRKTSNLYSHRFMSLYNLKKRCLMMQSLLFWVSIYIYIELSGHSTAEMILTFIIVYTHFATAIVGGLYFYGSLLCGYEFYYSLNRRLIQIFKTVEFNTESRAQMERYCQACDELDKVSLEYTRISSYVASVNKLFAVQVSLELLGSFLMITCSLFYIFYAVLSTQDSLAAAETVTWKEPVFEILNSVMYTSVFFAEIYTISIISNAVIDEAEKLPTYIHRNVSFINADKRFIRSVQQLSLKAFIERPKISPMGMFIIDKPLIIGIVATIATYLVILIQFQLDRKQRSAGIL